jgi:hypothetical protein
VSLGIDLLPDKVRKNFDVEERHHATAILKTDFPKEWDDLIAGLMQLSLPKSQIMTPGGGKSPIAKGHRPIFLQARVEEPKVQDRGDSRWHSDSVTDA